MCKSNSQLFCGTTNLHHLADNYKALTLSLSEQNLKDLDTLLTSIEVLGNRLPNGVRDLYLAF